MVILNGLTEDITAIAQAWHHVVWADKKANRDEYNNMFQNSDEVTLTL